MPYRPEFIEALKLLGRAFDAVVARGIERPVIVGGAAVEYCTAGDIMSGDFDLTTSFQEEVEEELVNVGFERRPAPAPSKEV